MATKPNTTESKDETKRPENVVAAYRDRLKILKQAQEYSHKNDIPKAVEKYSYYLGILASYYKVKEPELSPKLFDPQKDITEMLLISHAYWDLAKAYDRSPKLQKECIRCLQQFVTFTLGHKFQHVNSHMLKKFLKGNKLYNKKAFEQALQRINVESKACYIATHCYPNNENNILTDLRSFKDKIVHTRIGYRFVDCYYHISPKIVQLAEKNVFFNLITKLIMIPLIRIIHRALKFYESN